MTAWVALQPSAERDLEVVGVQYRFLLHWAIAISLTAGMRWYVGGAALVYYFKRVLN
jgi:hypothetical protein